MKRYLVIGREKEGDAWPERLKEIEAGTRKTAFDLGDGQMIVGGELDEGGFCMIVECEGSVEEFLADMLTLADAEIKPIALCPKDCTKCPETVLVAPLREP